MSYFTQRHGMRKPIEKTDVINRDVYSVLLNCCEKHYKYLTHIYPRKCHDDFTDKDYLAFDKFSFFNRIKITIPTLTYDKFNVIVQPNKRYDQYAVLDLIEYLAQNIQDISEGWNNQRYQNYWHTTCLESEHIKNTFSKEINDIFIESGLLYVLTDEKTIERIIENTPLTTEVEKQVSEVKGKGLQDLLNDSILLFKSPYPNANKAAVEKIWDALENLKTYFKDSDKKQADQKVSDILSGKNPDMVKLFEKELSELGNIGNNYGIRHFNDRQIEVSDSRHYDYFFNRCLSLISLALKYLK